MGSCTLSGITCGSPYSQAEIVLQFSRLLPFFVIGHLLRVVISHFTWICEWYSTNLVSKWGVDIYLVWSVPFDKIIVRLFYLNLWTIIVKTLSYDDLFGNKYVSQHYLSSIILAAKKFLKDINKYRIYLERSFLEFCMDVAHFLFLVLWDFPFMCSWYRISSSKMNIRVSQSKNRRGMAWRGFWNYQLSVLSQIWNCSCTEKIFWPNILWERYKVWGELLFYNADEENFPTLPSDLPSMWVIFPL